MDHNQFLFESVIGFPSQLLLDNTEGHQDGTVLLSSTNQSQISNQNMVEMGKKLLEAASENNIDAVRSLMSGGAPFTGNWLGTTPLHAAAKAGHVETVELLLKAGIFRDARTKVERTALQMAAEEGHTSIVQMLLEYGADVNARDMLKMTALHWAVERCHKDSVSILLAHGADVTAVNKFDKTPLDIALDNQNGNIIKTLEEASSASCIGHVQSMSETRIATEKLESELRCDTSKEDWKTSPEEEALEKLTANSCNTSSREAVKLLESHGISFLPTDNSTMLTSALESGQSIGLTEAGKMALKQIQTTNTLTAKTTPQPSIAKKPKVVAPKPTTTGLPRVVTLTADQLLALATKLQAKGSNKPVIITLPKNVGLPVQASKLLAGATRCTKPTIAPAILRKPTQPRVSSLSEFLAGKSIPNPPKPAPNPIKEVPPLLSMPNLTDDGFIEPTANNINTSTNTETIIPDPLYLGFDQIVHTTSNEETIETSVETSMSLETLHRQDDFLPKTDECISSRSNQVELDKKLYFLKSGLLKGSARTTPMTLLWKRKRKHSSMEGEAPDTEVTASVAMTPVESSCQSNILHRSHANLNNAAAPLEAEDMFINDESGSNHGHNPPVWLSIMDDNQYSADNDDDLLDPTKLAAQLASIKQAASQYSFSS